eukprot:g3777.t1
MNAFEREFHEYQNQLRAVHGVPPLTYDSNVARTAQEWANHLRNIGTLTHGNMKNHGQNLAVSISDVSGEKVCQIWYDEGEAYDYNEPGWNKDCTNFTQMIWKSTKKIGVGVAKRPDGMVYIVAHYYPAGNVGSFRNNVRPPSKMGSPLVQKNRIVVPVPESGRVPPPPPPPPEIPPPPPGKSNNFLRKAMLEMYSPFNMRREARESPTSSVNALASSSASKYSLESGGLGDAKRESSSNDPVDLQIVLREGGGDGGAANSGREGGSMHPKLMRALSEEGRRMKHDSALVKRKSTAEKYWEAARHMVRFKRPKGVRAPPCATAAYTSIAKRRATCTFGQDPAMLQANEVMRREFLDNVESSSELMQQLRGIFSAADLDGDGLLTIPELEEALLCFGVLPTDDLIEHFIMLSRGGGKIDLATFIYVFSKTRGNVAVKDCSSEILELFQFLEKPFEKEMRSSSTKGQVSSPSPSSLRVRPRDIEHILAGVATPNRLSRDEVHDFMVYADAKMRKSGLARGLNEATLEDILGAVLTIT